MDTVFEIIFTGSCEIIVREKSSTIYTKPQLSFLFIYFFPPLFSFLFQFSDFSKVENFCWKKIYLALKKHKFSNKQFAITALPSLPGLPEYPFDIPGDISNLVDVVWWWWWWWWW